MSQYTNLPTSYLGFSFKVKNECIAINDFGVLSDVNSSQRIVARGHGTLQEDGKKELQLFHHGISYPM